jgi:hypothetical protein
MEQPALKLCKGPLCNGIEKPLTDFSPRQSQCKKCVCHKTKEYYKLHDRHYRVFKNEGEKNINIFKSFSKAAIEKELALTQVLCAWCHRLKRVKKWMKR